MHKTDKRIIKNSFILILFKLFETSLFQVFLKVIKFLNKVKPSLSQSQFYLNKPIIQVKSFKSNEKDI